MEDAAQALHEKPEKRDAAPWMLPAGLDSILRPACLALLVLALFWPAFFYDFANYDDLDTVSSNPFIGDLGPDGLKRIFTFFSLKSFYPVRLLSIAIDFKIWGYDPRGYHATNVFIHLLSTLLAYALFIRLKKTGGPLDAGGQRAAFWAAALFGLHPSVVDSVAWISGREELLMLLFLLSALHVHMYALKARGPARFLLFVLTGYLAAFSCLSNILGVAVAPLALAMSFLVFGQRRPARLLAETWHLWLLALAAFFIKLVSLGVYDQSTQAILFPYVPSAIKNAGHLIGRGLAEQAAALDAIERARLVVSLFGSNLFQALFPARLPVMYENVYPGSFFTPRMLIGFLALVLAAFAFRMARKKPLALFGLAWFLISLLPSAQIIPHHIFRADRFLYLPLVGFGLFASVMAHEADKPAARRWAGALFVLWAAALSARAAVHLPVWSDALTLHSYCVSQSPNNALVRRYLGVELSRLSMYDEALVHLKEAVRLAPERNEFWSISFQTFVRAGRLADAEDFARQGTARAPGNQVRWNDLGMILAMRKKQEEALKAFEKALSISPDDDTVNLNTGCLLWDMGKSGRAIEHLRKAVRANPKNSVALFRLGEALEDQGRKDEAIRHYREAVRWAPGYLPPRRRLKELEAQGPAPESAVSAKNGSPA